MHARSLPSRLLAFLALAPLAAAQQELFATNGDTGKHHLGASLARFHDVNGDGWRDHLAGMIGETNSDLGRVRILSGRYLATGVGSPTLLDVVGPTDEYGTSVIDLDDLDGDGVFDLTVGAPNRAIGTGFGFPGGAVVLHDALGNKQGEIEAQVIFEEFGAAIALLPDLNGDGVKELLVGSPGFTGGIPSIASRGKAAVYSGAHALLDLEVVLRVHMGDFVDERFGSAVATGFIDGDSVADYVVATPHRPSGGGAPDSGRISVYSGATGALIRTLGGAPGSQFGASVASGLDVTGDGVHDVIVGAPYSSNNGVESGAAYVYSGANLVNGPLVVPILSWNGPAAGAHFGASVALVQDLNGDGDADMVVGAPDYEPTLFGNDNGQLRCFSGETGELMGVLTGAIDEHLGAAFATADKLDANPGWEFLVGCPASTIGGTPSGRVASVSIFPNNPTVYCTAKTNSLGCTPGIQGIGKPSVTLGVQFDVKATKVLNNVPGILVYAYGAGATPFQGAFLCVGTPLTRLGAKLSGGTPPPAVDCSGALAFDFNAQITGGVDPALVPGQEVFCQIWSRDVNAIGGSSLTAGLRFLIHP